MDQPEARTLGIGHTRFMPLRLLPWLLAALVWVLTVALPADHWAAELPRATRSAQQLAAEGRPAEALALLDGRPTGRTPGIDHRIAAAFAALGQGLSGRARVELDAALLINGADPHAWLGRCLLSGVEEPLDVAPCQRLSELSSDEPECAPLLARAWGSLRRGHLEDARSELNQCAALEPDHWGISSVDTFLVNAEERAAVTEQR